MTGTLTLLWLLGITAPAGVPGASDLSRFEFSGVEMAVPIRIVLYAGDKETAAGAAEAALKRIGQLNDILSDYDPESELRRLCVTSGPGNPVPVGPDLWKVLTAAQSLSKRSDGAFDVTVGPVVRLWRRARRQTALPSEERLRAARQLVDYRLVRLHPDRRAVELGQADMRLDLGGIAKGYAVDEALAVLREHGITRALVDAGGDLAVGDPPPDRPGWRIAVARLANDGPPSDYLQLVNRAVATSGDAWQFVEIDGWRYSHIVDPHTGVGLTDHASVTVVAADCITADSLASAVSVLGPQKGLALIEATPEAAALIVRAPEGTVQSHRSQRWKELPLDAVQHEK